MGGTFTPNLHLYKPLHNEVGWDAKVNSNFDVLDAAVPAEALVTSVFSRTGAVVAAANDYAAVDNLLLADNFNESIQLDSVGKNIKAEAQNGISLISASGAQLQVGDTNGDSNFYLQGGTSSLQTNAAGTVLNITSPKVDLSASTEVDVPTPATADSSKKAASTAFVKACLAALSAIATSGKWSDLQNSTAALVLANGANGTEFDQTSSAIWKWFNTTTATSGTTNASPILDLSANYWTGSASAEDKWTLQSSLGAGTNGASTLTFAHSGSTGSAVVKAPAFTPSVVAPASGGFGLYGASQNLALVGNTSSTSVLQVYGGGGSTLVWSLGWNGANYAAVSLSTGIVAWSSSTSNASASSLDTGISRLGAASLALGNGTAGDFSGALTLGALTQSNPTVATNVTTNASPVQTYSANYWTGAASAPDTWTIQSSLAAGTNGFSTLTFAHSGSTNAGIAGGVAQVSVPRLLINTGLSQPICFYMAGGVNGVVLQDYANTGDMILFKTNASYQMIMRSTLVLGWFSGTSLSGGGTACDSGFSRLGAASVALGNGTQGDFSGSLKLTNLNVQGTLTTYNAEATAGVGTGYIRGVTLQKAETGADASVLSVTPAAAAGLYRIAVVLSVSAASAATLGWTASWRDSNGNAQAPANLSLNTAGSATIALTVAAAANGTYYGEWYVDVNNAGTAIVIKTTFTGTSIAYKATATIERMA